MKKVMKKVLIIFLSILGAAILAIGLFLAYNWHEANTPNFDRYWTHNYDDGDIKYPNFQNAQPWGATEPMQFCYMEIDDACFQYAKLIWYKYNNNADLDFTVENTGKVLTIKFTGTGYPEDGEPEPLERTYIFDVDGIGKKKLPVLLNRAEIIGY